MSRHTQINYKYIGEILICYKVYDFILVRVKGGQAISLSRKVSGFKPSVYRDLILLKFIVFPRFTLFIHGFSFQLRNNLKMNIVEYHKH